VTYHPINFSLPGVGIIAVIGRQYETLTDEFIQQWLYDLYRDYLVTPDYLLVSQEVRHELHRIVMSDLHMYSWVTRNAQDDRGEVAERYPNRITGKSLTMVVFPGLPEKTLFLASMLKMAHEEVQVRGSTSVVTRSYERL
jgi:hypothetical protein